MRVISHREVVELLPMEACISLMETALTQLAQGQSVQYLRNVYPLGGQAAFALMPGELRTEHVVGVKVITIIPDNHNRSLPSHQGVVTIFDSENGQVKAVMDAEAVTAIRTAAASAAATKLLARADASTLAVIGTGVQAQSHLEAMLLVRRISKVMVYGRNTEKALVFKDEMEQKYGVPITVCSNVQEAVVDADIVCTVTASTVPILLGEWVKPGVHINAVGACRRTDRELDTHLVRQAKLYTDRLESAKSEAGDYLIPLQEGAISESHLLGELGDLIVGKVSGRTSNSDITIFESLGIGIEDLASAEYIYREAVARGIGVEVDF